MTVIVPHKPNPDWVTGIEYLRKALGFLGAQGASKKLEEAWGIEVYDPVRKAVLASSNLLSRRE